MKQLCTHIVDNMTNLAVEINIRVTKCIHCLLQNDFGNTALVTAVNRGHVHVAEILVKNGANVNYRNKVRALIPVTQVCIMSPVIRHGVW